MHLLVTGASGFIGRNMLLALPRTWSVVALYRPGNIDFLNFLQEHQLEHIQPLACDLTDRLQVEQAMSWVKRDFECCLALASNTSIPGSITEPIQDLMTNSVGLLHILEHCTIGHLVYLSSGAVYVGLRGLVSPASAVSPDLPYAISKLATEQYIAAFVRHRATPRCATIIRFFGAYGPHEPARKLYTKLVRQFAFERNSHFTVVGDGENYIDAMYVDDAIRALKAVLTGPIPQGVHRVDLGVGSCETVNQVVIRAARTFGLEPQLHHEGSSAEYIQFMIDPRTFSSTYQVTPEIPLEVGLKQLAIHLAQKKSKAYAGD
jgi:UDP-glucose 4-epimerase